MLPQLAVSAKILCLLMVLICGAVPSTVKLTTNRSVQLFSTCSHRYVNVYKNGTVMARSDGTDNPTLTISGDSSLALLIYSPIHQLYLCFHRKRLVGKKMTRSQAQRQSNCLFKEELLEDGYNRYRLVKSKDRYMGFTRFGVQIHRVKSRAPSLAHCFTFVKDQAEFDIGKHNTMVANMPRSYPQRKLPPPFPNKLLRHGVRHRHSRRQRQRN